MWTLTVRRRGVVERERHETVGAAVARLDARLDELVRSERRATEQAFARTVPPVAQVAARVELRGPGRARGGVDVRGDGSTEAFTGRVRRRLVERRAGETSAEALARALGA